MKKNILFKTAAILITIFLFTQCSDDDEFNPDKNTVKGQLKVSITDAPSDDDNIQGMFVTISEIKVDGETVDGFSKQTIEISAYQEGNTKLLFDDDFEARSYNSLTLVLDYESDASGNSPGCYVLDNDSEKHNLAAESETEGEIEVSKPFEVEENSKSEIVIDFDLRKSVARDDDEQTQSEYKFVSHAEMQNSLRVVSEDECGNINGDVNNQSLLTGDIYVFAYEKGEFSSAESQGQGSSNVLFANAVTSAKVKPDGSFYLSFLEEGDYEVHVASFQKGSDNKFMFQGMLNISSSISGQMLNYLTVSASSNLQLEIEINELL